MLSCMKIYSWTVLDNFQRVSTLSGDNVGDKWILGTVMCSAGSISYKDMTTSGELKIHLDHSRKKETATNETIYLKLSEPTKKKLQIPSS